MSGHVTVETGYGPITVTRHLRDLWNTCGWPKDETLRRMARTEREIREAKEHG